MSSFTTEAFSLLGVGLFIIALRTAARVSSVGIRGLKPDDYLMLGAAVIYSLETATAYVVGAWWEGLANNGMTDEERKALDLTSHEAHLRIGGSKTQLVGWSLYTLLLWTLKLCLTIFYSRLVSGLDMLEKRVKIAYVLIGVTYFTTELSILFGCHPFHKNWQIYPDPGNHCEPAISQIDLYVTVILNVLTDMFLMSIPLPMLWRANLSVKRKISLIIVFGGGVFVMAAGILRCAIIIKSPVTGAQAAGSWAVRETFVAVVIGNLPMIYPVVNRELDKFFHSSFLSRYNIGGSSNQKAPSYQLNPTIGSERMRDRGGRKKVRSVHALPTTYHEGDSEERIVNVGETIVEEGKSDSSWKGGGIVVTRETDVEFGRREPSTRMGV